MLPIESSLLRLDNFKNRLNTIQIFQVVKIAFWQGYFFCARRILRTRAGTDHIDATSRKDFLRRYCKDPTRTVIPNGIDEQTLLFGAKGRSAMECMLTRNPLRFCITLQAGALRTMLHGSTSSLVALAVLNRLTGNCSGAVVLHAQSYTPQQGVDGF